MALLDRRVLIVLALAAAGAYFYLRRPPLDTNTVVLLANKRVSNDSGVVQVTVNVMNESAKTLDRVRVRCAIFDPLGNELDSKVVEVKEKPIAPGYRGDVVAKFNLEGRQLKDAECTVAGAE